MQPLTVAIIQARMAATRLPGKVLMDIAGQPMLTRVVERVRRATTIDTIIVATTTDPADDAVSAFCQEHQYLCFRGSAHDVLDRYYQAAKSFEAGIIVRITGDCPIIDPQVIDITVNAFLFWPDTNAQQSAFRNPKTKISWDFAANRLPPPWGRTYPIGLDTEVCTFQALERAWKEADQPHQREHVMPYLYETGRSVHFSTLQTLEFIPPIPASHFKILRVDHEPDYGTLRWTVDTPEDLVLIRQVYDYFQGRDDFSWREVLDLFEKQPELAQINAGVRHKNVHDVDNRTSQY